MKIKQVMLKKQKTGNELDTNITNMTNKRRQTAILTCVIQTSEDEEHW